MGGDRLKNARFALLYADERDVALWRESLKEAGYTNVAYIDICAFDWYRQCINAKPELYILRPPGLTNFFKSMFDERVRILSTPLTDSIRVSWRTIMRIKNLAYWLEANKIPHPETWVFIKRMRCWSGLLLPSFPCGKINIEHPERRQTIVTFIRPETTQRQHSQAETLRGPKLVTFGVKMKNSIRKKGLIKVDWRVIALLYRVSKCCIIQSMCPRL